ncbi:hypothetical protein Naga_101579g1, partial [Nannochloropsis gaditana]
MKTRDRDCNVGGVGSCCGKRTTSYAIPAKTFKSTKTKKLASLQLLLITGLILGLASMLWNRVRALQDPLRVVAPLPPSSSLAMSERPTPISSFPPPTTRTKTVENESQNPATAILMVDTRDLFPPPEAGNPAFWYGYLTAANNRLYACKHGYAFVFAHVTGPTFASPPTKESPVEGEMGENREEVEKYGRGCRGKEGMRAAPWCKVYVLARVLRRYLRVVFLDTDAMVANMSMPVEDWLTWGKTTPGGGGKEGREEEEGEEPLYVSGDLPFRRLRVNTGGGGRRGGREGGREG